MNNETYEKLSVLEDFYWGMKADKAARDGFLGSKESEKRLRKYGERAGIKIDGKLDSKTKAS
ncbi:MAG: hypothetical protein K0R24_531 [Gammaproteobacteria bacterium]|jgi:hypothetical protein|nr:hypothetical protein [Gammaproteobacteria bacterium]